MSCIQIFRVLYSQLPPSRIVLFLFFCYKNLRNPTSIYVQLRKKYPRYRMHFFNYYNSTFQWRPLILWSQCIVGKNPKISAIWGRAKAKKFGSASFSNAKGRCIPRFQPLRLHSCTYYLHIALFFHFQPTVWSLILWSRYIITVFTL